MAYAANGPGKYDDLCTYVREQAQAESVLVLISGGNLGEGFSVQAPEDYIGVLPSLLRELAKQIEASQQR